MLVFTDANSETFIPNGFLAIPRKNVDRVRLETAVPPVFGKEEIMKHVLLSFSLIICLAGFVFAEGTPEQEGASAPAAQTSPEMRTIIDMAGNSITIPAEGATFGIFGGPISQIPAVLGVTDSVVAVTKGAQMMEFMRTIDPTIETKPAPRSTNGNINVEELMIADPDCVIAFDVDGNIVKEQTDIQVIFLTGTMQDGFEELKEEALFFGDVFMQPDRAKTYVDYLDETLDLLETRLGSIPKEKKIKVFIGEGPTHLATLGGDTFISQWLDAAGMRNAVFEVDTAGGHQEGLHSGFLEISMEQVILSNPDIIIIDTGKSEELYEDPKWQEISAIKNRQVYRVPTGVFLWSRPSLESAVTYPLWLAYKAYPELFADRSLADRYKDFYKTIFSYEPDDETVSRIINGQMGKVVFGQIDKKR